MRITLVFKVITDILIGLIPLFLLYYTDLLKDNNNLLVFVTENKIYFIILFIFSFLINKVLDYKEVSFQDDRKKLLEGIKSYRSFLSAYIDYELKEIANKLNNTESERITVFLYSSSLDKFFSIGRYSHSPKFNKVNRYVIDNKKEYVYSVLNEEKHYDNSPVINNKWYHRKRNKRNMESEDMFGVPLFDNKGQNKIGVVVFQSMKQKRFTKSKEVRNSVSEEVKALNERINEMNIDPNTMISNSSTLEGL